MEQKSTLKEIAALFLKLGFIGFGGPAAHIAIMQQEVVKKKKWLTEEHFLDLVGYQSNSRPKQYRISDTYWL